MLKKLAVLLLTVCIVSVQMIYVSASPKYNSISIENVLSSYHEQLNQVDVQLKQLETELQIAKEQLKHTQQELLQSEIQQQQLEVQLRKEEVRIKEAKDAYEEKLSDIQSERIQIHEKTICELEKAGYEAYYVNENTFDAVQTELSTDLEDLGLDPTYSYIIVVGEEPIKCNVNKNTVYAASTGSEYNHTYNGITYKLRTLTVTAADDPMYGKATTVNLLTSNSQTLLQNCLDTAISAVISSVSNILGTVASICGSSISNLNTSQTSTLNLNGGTNWTVVYIQVYDSMAKTWIIGSSVEYVRAEAYLSGQYYSASQNKYVSVPSNSVSIIKYSSNYSNTTWRNDNAVFGYLILAPQWNIVGDVVYKYGGSTKITHTENF